jgi:hypothetical protein
MRFRDCFESPIGDQIAENEFELYEACILSEQVAEPEIQALMRDNPDFSAWFREQCRLRRLRREAG